MTNDEYVEISGNALRRLSIIRERIITEVLSSGMRPRLEAVKPLLDVQERIMIDMVAIENEFWQAVRSCIEV